MDAQTFAQLNANAEANYSARQALQKKSQPKQQKKKGPSGIAGFLVNNLPAIGGGLGAIAGIPGDLFSAGASSVAGGAAGAGLGEAIKQKFQGQSISPTQVAIQAGEGGILSGIGGAAKGITGAAKGFAEGGAKATTEAAGSAEKSTGGSFLKNLTTQGQQMQARGLGISAGNKEAGKVLFPQDTAKMLDTLKSENIPVKTANSTGQAIKDKLDQYGKQIADHFKTNNSPLKAEDTKVIGDNFVKSLATTDPRILKEADILSNDLQKNVKSTKDLWEFRKSLDSRIPDAKLATDVGLSNKIAATKSMRQYISKELGAVPGMSNYHELADIKQFLPKGMKELNQPTGGIIGRVLSSGPAQKAEAIVGKGAEKLGSIGSPEAQIEQAVPSGGNFLTKLIGTVKASANPKELARTVAAPIGSPGKAAVAVGKQQLGRGFGIPAALANQTQNAQDQSTQALNDAKDLTGNISSIDQPSSDDPFAPENVQSSVQKILAQGGTMKDVSEYLSNAKALQDLSAAGNGKPLNSTQQQQANNAISGLQDIQSLSDMLGQDPSLTVKSAIPGGSIAQRLTGTTDFDAAKSNIIDVISRLRSGAAISASEEKLYKSLLPAAGDSSLSANAKLNRLANLLGSFAQPSNAGGSDAQDLLAGAGL